MLKSDKIVVQFNHFQTPNLITQCLNFVTMNTPMLDLSASREAVSNLINGVLESLRVEHEIEKRFRFSGPDHDQLYDFTYLARREPGFFLDYGTPVLVSMRSSANGHPEPHWSEKLVAANMQTESLDYANVMIDLDLLRAETEVCCVFLNYPTM